MPRMPGNARATPGRRGSAIDLSSIRVIGNGRMGRALVEALRGSGVAVHDAGLRGDTGGGAEIVILAVPDAAIPEAAALVAPGSLVGHLSGATPLAALAPHERFSLHPLMTITGAEPGFSSEVESESASEFESESEVEIERATNNPFDGVFAAVAASSDRARETAEYLARALGMTPFAVAEADRGAYHAAASIASNFLVALEWFAERLAETAGVEREVLVPLVTAAARNWAAVGPKTALTGPIARGDEETVAWQREAVAERLPEHLDLFDRLVEATRMLANRAKQ